MIVTGHFPSSLNHRFGNYRIVATSELQVIISSELSRASGIQ
jgi:hypothetical protein